MKVLGELAPLGIAVALAGALTWFLLTRDIGIGMWLLAFLLVAHGWVHVMFLFPQPDAAAASAGGMAYPFDMSRSWLIDGIGLDAGAVRALGTALVGLVLVTSVLAAMATLGWLVPATWWVGLVVASAMGSAVLLALFYAPGLLIGFAIDIGLVWFALASIWRPIGA